MANKFTDYDMRKFAVNDTKDVYAFFDALSKGIKQTETLVKRLSMSNAAQASTIRSLERRIGGLTNNEALGGETVDVLEAAHVVLGNDPAENLIQKLKSAAAGEETVKEAAVVSEPSEGEDADDTPEEQVDKDSVTFRGYAKRKFSNGQYRYLLDGLLVKGADVPEDIRSTLDELLG